jgi:hypothetical protein
LFPNHRYAYQESVYPFLWRGQRMFEPMEIGHPADSMQQTHEPPLVYRNDPLADVDRINAMNRATAQQVPPGMPAMPGVPQSPGVPQPQPMFPQPYQPPTPGQPPTR